MRGKTLSKTKARLDKYYSDSAPSYGILQKWFTEFFCGRTNTEPIPSLGHPNEITTPDMINKFHDIVLNDLKVKVREIAISTEHVVNILLTHFLVFVEMHIELSLSTTLRKEKRLLEHIILHYWTDWLTKSGRNGHFWRRKKSFFIMIMHHLTRRTLHRQKSIKWVSNRFRIHRILQTWPPATIIWSKTSRDGYVVGVFSRKKKLNGKQKGIFEVLTNRIISKAYKSWKIVELIVSSWKENTLRRSYWL